MNADEALGTMVAPGDVRDGIWRGGILQIMVTRACDKACFHCTQGSNLAGKPVMMTPEDFETACRSLAGYWGVVGMFGGNPAMHPQFEQLCDIFTRYFPFAQRGLWCNHPRGKGAIMRRTFNPDVSNLNVHLDMEAYEEFARDWPECRHKLKGHDQDSRHAPVFKAMIDLEDLPFPDGSRRENTPENRRELFSNCDINQTWSAIVCSVPGHGLRAFFCEVAGAQAMLHGLDSSWPDLGKPAIPGWWREPMQAFADQVEHYCHRCGEPCREYGQLAIGGEFEEVSATHADIYKPKVRDREVRVVQLDSGRFLRKATDYIENGALA